MNDLWADFVTFARAHLATWDIDPAYPVLRETYASEKLDPETALWRTLVYLAFYDLSSAEKAWIFYPTPSHVDPSRLMGYKTGIERRGFRGNTKAGEHLNATLDLVTKAGGLLRWVEQAIDEGDETGWRMVRLFFQGLPYCGPWASYKWADLLKWVHGYKITADDIGVGGKGETAGPIPGMVALTGMSWQACAGDVFAQRNLLKKRRQGECRSKDWISWRLACATSIAW